LVKRGKLHTADGKLIIYVRTTRTHGCGPAQGLTSGREASSCRAFSRPSATPLIDGSFTTLGRVRADSELSVQAAKQRLK
jgi:hypothetical protein